jgi:N-acetylneuraminic acid mutarotase
MKATSWLIGGVGLAALLLTAGLMQPARTQPAAGGAWSTKSPMAGQHNEIPGVTVGGKIYTISGSNRTDYDLKGVEEYDPATDRWRARAAIPSGVNHGTAAVVNGKVYVFGGFSKRQHGDPITAVQEYDPAADSWRKVGDLKTALGSISAVALDGKIHLIGGRGAKLNSTVANHDIYDPATNTWTAAAPLSGARDHIMMVVADGKIHAIGGRTAESSDFVNTHEIYDPKTNAWASGPPLPTPRSNGTGVLYKGMIVVMGGEGGPTGVFVENEGFDLKTGQWSTLAPLPAGLHGMASAVVGDTAYVIGGSLGNGSGSATEQLLAFRLP